MKRSKVIHIGFIISPIICFYFVIEPFFSSSNALLIINDSAQIQTNGLNFLSLSCFGKSQTTEKEITMLTSFISNII